jgi:hypothetical protein
MVGRSSEEESCRVDQVTKELVRHMAPVFVVTVALATALTSAPLHPPPATPSLVSSLTLTPTTVVTTSDWVRNMDWLTVVEPALVAARSDAAATLVAPRLIPQAALAHQQP